MFAKVSVVDRMGARDYSWLLGERGWTVYQNIKNTMVRVRL